jgi:hypothetical protein
MFRARCVMRGGRCIVEEGGAAYSLPPRPLPQVFSRPEGRGNVAGERHGAGIVGFHGTAGVSEPMQIHP